MQQEKINDSTYEMNLLLHFMRYILNCSKCFPWFLYAVLLIPNMSFLSTESFRGVLVCKQYHA
jgi:hypothetical protein